MLSMIDTSDLHVVSDFLDTHLYGTCTECNSSMTISIIVPLEDEGPVKIRCSCKSCLNTMIVSYHDDNFTVNERVEAINRIAGIVGDNGTQPKIEVNRA